MISGTGIWQARRKVLREIFLNNTPCVVCIFAGNFYRNTPSMEQIKKDVCFVLLS
jgi:hypothetical protein